MGVSLDAVKEIARTERQGESKAMLAVVTAGAWGSMITLLLATCTAVEGAIRVLIYRSRILAAYAATDGDAAHPESNVYDPVWANLVGYHPEN